jgi:hypothetical protein
MCWVSIGNVVHFGLTLYVDVIIQHIITSLQNKPLDKTTGQNHWTKPLDNTTGQNLWKKTFYRIFLNIL